MERPETPELNGTLTVRVVSASRLTNLNGRLRGISDPFCRVTAHPSLAIGSLPEIFETEVVYNCLSPEWNIDTSVNSWSIDWSGTKPSRSTRVDPLPEASSPGHQAWEPAKGNSAVVSSLGSGGRSTSKKKLTKIDGRRCNLSLSDPEYVVQKTIAELQREVEFWKEKREVRQTDSPNSSFFC